MIVLDFLFSYDAKDRILVMEVGSAYKDSLFREDFIAALSQQHHRLIIGIVEDQFVHTLQQLVGLLSLILLHFTVRST